jgi:anti-anti-sigma regulatory factor
MAVKFRMEADDRALVARLSGPLSLAEVVDVRISLLKCLAEQPKALLVDLSDLTVLDPLALSVFTAVVRQAARWPGTPVLFCAPGPGAARLLASPAYRRLVVLDSLDSGRGHVAAGTYRPRVVSEEMLPVGGSSRRGRDVVTDACLRWDLPHLVAPASLVVSELIGNAVDHAGTMMTLRVSQWQRYFFVAVRDGSTAEPPAAVRLPAPYTVGGRGLFLVDATAHSWGCLPARDGKVVWASMLVNPR